MIDGGLGDAQPPSPDTQRVTHLARSVVAAFGLWTLLALLSVGQTALYLRHEGATVPWRGLLLSRLSDWYTCALFLPFLLWLARRSSLVVLTNGARGLWAAHTIVATMFNGQRPAFDSFGVRA